MRLMRYVSYLLAVCVFVLVHVRYAALQARYSRLSGYSRALTDFLGFRNERSRYLLILFGGKVRGYSGLRVERLFKEMPARYRVSLEAYLHMVPVLKERGDVELNLVSSLNDSGLVEQVTGELGAFGKRFLLEGKRRGTNLELRIRTPGSQGSLLSVPAELGFGGPVFPLPPLGNLHEGESRSFSYFDPLTRRQAVMRLRVTEKKQVQLAGIKIEGYAAEVTSPVGRFTVIASSTGEILSVVGPAGISLRRTTEAEVRRRFGPPGARRRIREKGVKSAQIPEGK